MSLKETVIGSAVAVGIGFDTDSDTTFVVGLVIGVVFAATLAVDFSVVFFPIVFFPADLAVTGFEAAFVADFVLLVAVTAAVEVFTMIASQGKRREKRYCIVIARMQAESKI